MPRLDGPDDVAMFLDDKKPGVVTVPASDFFQNNNRISCPILRVENATVTFEHPSEALSAELSSRDDTPQRVAVRLASDEDEPIVALVTAAATGRDTEGGDRHGFLAAAAINTFRPREPFDADCLASAGFNTSVPKGQEMEAIATCFLSDLRTIPNSFETKDGEVVSFQAELVSDAWFKADHGSGLLGSIRNGARYRLQLRSIYQFRLVKDEIEVISETPDRTQPLDPSAIEDFDVIAQYSLSSSETGVLRMRLDHTQADATTTLGTTEEAVARCDADVTPEQCKANLVIPGITIPDEGEFVLVLELLDDAGRLLDTVKIPYFLSVDLTIDRIEVVQVVQDRFNSIPLVTGKAFAIRVFAKLALPATDQTGIPLSVEIRIGSDAELVTLSGQGVTITEAPFGGNKNHSYNLFSPPIAELDGDLTIKAVINPDRTIQETNFENNTLETTVSFERQPGLRVKYLPVCIQLEGQEPSCPSDDIWVLGEVAKRLFPVADTDFKFSKLDYSESESGKFIWEKSLSALGNEQELLQRLEQVYAQEAQTRGGQATFDQLIGILPEKTFDPASGFLIPNLGNVASGVAAPMWGGKAGRVSIVLDQSSNPAVGFDITAYTVAHEIGHNLGLRHPKRCTSVLDSISDIFLSRAGQEPTPSRWPFPKSNIQEHGADPLAQAIKVGAPVGHPEVQYDFMDSCDPRFQWISGWHYVWVHSGGFQPTGAEPVLDVGLLSPEATATVTQQSGEFAFITGRVDRVGSAGEINGVERFNGTTTPFEPGAAGGFCLQFLDAAGATVGEHCFDVSFVGSEGGAPADDGYFSQLVRLPADTARVSLQRNQTELDFLLASANAPTLEITSPPAGQRWEGGDEAIRWTGQDADGDPLLYSVFYSPDDTGDWRSLAIDLSATELVFDPAVIRGGPNVQFRVSASDGYHRTEADVGPIDVIQQPQIAVSDGVIDFGEAVVGQSTVGQVSIESTGIGPLDVASITSDSEAFEVLAALPLSISSGQGRSIAVRYTASMEGLAAATLSISSNAVDRPEATIEVQATGTDGQTPRIEIAREAVGFPTAIIESSRMAVVAVRNASLVDLEIDWTLAPSEVFSPLTELSSFTLGPGESTGIELAFAPTRPGSFDGTLTIRSNDPDRPEVSLPLAGSSIELPEAPSGPVYSSAGIVDAAQFQATLSPGGLGSIFGSDLAPSIAGATSTPLPTELAGVRVEVDGILAPLIFISPNQINFQMPFEAAGKRSVQIRVVRDGVTGPSVQAQTSAFAPQVFANPATGEPIVIRQDTSLVDAAHPATDGEVFIVFLTGVGGLDNPPPSGAATPGSPLASATEETTVTIGGQPAEVFFNGLTPGFVGLAQVNIRANIPALPAAALSPEGSRGLTTMPLVVTVGGVSSEPLDFPVDVPGGLPPQIDTQPSGLDFGEVALGQSAQLSVTVFNRGGSNLSIGPVVATTDEFAALAPTGPVSIGPGASQPIQVSFSPAAEGTRFGTLRISSNDPNNPQFDVPLVGRGTAEAGPASLAIMPSSLDFGTVEVGQSAMRDATVQNTGGQALSLTSMASSDPAQFAVQLLGPALPTQLEPGGAYPVRIVFQPSGAGDQTAMLSASGGSASAQATLRGSGKMVQPPASSLVVTRNVLNFGGVSFGRTNELPVVVRNDGAAAATISAVASTDPQFVLAAPAVPIEVAPGQEALLRIHFTPANPGLQQATLTVSTPGGPLPTPVAVTGTGQEGPKVLFSDSFNRADAPNCAIGVADNAFGGSGSHRYSAVAGGVRLRGGQIENAARDFGGVAFSTEQAACPGAATTTGQDLNIRATVFVPRDGDRSTQAGPFFHAPKLGSGAQLHGGGQAGHWVQVDSSGTIYAIRLDTGQVVATSHAVPGFDPTVPHVIEAAVRGATAEVAIDGRLRLFDQGAGMGRSSISLVPTGNLGAGAAGVGFSAYDGPGSVGGQTMDDVVVTEHESLAGLPVAR